MVRSFCVESGKEKGRPWKIDPRFKSMDSSSVRHFKNSPSRRLFHPANDDDGKDDDDDGMENEGIRYFFHLRTPQSISRVKYFQFRCVLAVYWNCVKIDFLQASLKCLNLNCCLEPDRFFYQEGSIKFNSFYEFFENVKCGFNFKTCHYIKHCFEFLQLKFQLRIYR